MNKYLILFLSSIAILLLIVGIASFGFSGHFYFTIFKEGVDSEYINIEASENNLLLGKNIKTTSGTLRKSIWSKAHVQNFLVPAPTSHPLLYVSPILKYRYKYSEVGLRFLSRSGAEMLRFYERRQKILKTEIDKNKLFSIPVVRKVIYDKPQAVLFKDIFQRDIFFGLKNVPEFSQALLFKILKTNWQDLVYNLFIFKLRQDYLDFPNIDYFGWDDKNNAGVVSFIGDKTGEKKEYHFYLRDGVIYSMALHFKDWNLQSKKVRSLFLNNIKFLKTNKDASVAIYGEYRTLSYKDQIGHDGLIFLLSAWSHHQDDQKFLKEMIQRLERSDDTKEQLRPLYKYAIERYKQTFSKKEEIAKDDNILNKIKNLAEEDEKRRMELEQEEMKNYQELEAMDFGTREEKMDHYLEEALKKE